MSEKKMILNCGVCDARKMKEEDYSHFEEIVLNADKLLVNEKSKGVLGRLPIVSNVDGWIEVPDDLEVYLQEVNGSFEISGNTRVQEHTILTVNGSLMIHTETEQILKNYLTICVNGSVRYPKSLEGLLNQMEVNGSISVYPDDCVILEDYFEIDKYFPLRAKEGGQYYAEQEVVVKDKTVDLEKLVQKKVQFVTERFVGYESMMETAIGLVEEQVKLVVVPDDLELVYGDSELNAELLKKYGSKLFIYQNLTLTEESISVLDRIERLEVAGSVNLTKSQLDAFRNVDADYQSINVMKGRQYSNKVHVTLDLAVFQHSAEGIQVRNAARVKIAKEVTPAMILENLKIENCGMVSCTKEQESAVQAIADNVGVIGDGGKDGTLEAANNLKDVVMINADSYVM